MNQSLKELLKGKLSDAEISLVPSSFDIVGDIAIFADFPIELKKKEKKVANALLELHKNIKVVCKKVGKYSGKYRLPKLKFIAGEKRKDTLHKENGVSILLDVEKCYFSPRSSNERKRIAGLVKSGEEVLIMFSGVAPFPLVIAKNSNPKSVCGIEINPTAHKYAVSNVSKNKLDSKITLFKGDVCKVVPLIGKKFDRVAMPLPKGGENFLSVALSAVKRGGMVHFYDFLHEDEFDKACEKVALACKKAAKKFKEVDFVKCGQFGPGVYRVCLDFKVL